jgi:uncharacterized protein YjhX (UPF0386 family)
MLLAVAFSGLVQAQAGPDEKQKIELLIKQVAQSGEIKFVRNGSVYSAGTAAMFLRLKWHANDAAVKTARDFINKVASFSGTSGQPYLIRMQDGTEMKSRDFLLAALQKIEISTPDKRARDG